MRQCYLYEAKAKLSELVQAALDGEEVLIARAGNPRLAAGIRTHYNSPFEASRKEHLS